MRKEHFSPPSKWTREFLTARNLSYAHLAVYAYCEGSPESHPTGIYILSAGTIADAIGEERDTVDNILDDLDKAGLIIRDVKNRLIWVPCMCQEQYRWRAEKELANALANLEANKGLAKGLRIQDNRIKEGKKHLSGLPKSNLVSMFYKMWPMFDEGACQGACQGAPNTTPYPSEGRRGVNWPAGAARAAQNPFDEISPTDGSV